MRPNSERDVYTLTLHTYTLFVFSEVIRNFKFKWNIYSSVQFFTLTHNTSLFYFNVDLCWWKLREKLRKREKAAEGKQTDIKRGKTQVMWFKNKNRGSEKEWKGKKIQRVKSETEKCERERESKTYQVFNISSIS